MPYLIGQKKTRELLMTGDLIDGVEAHRIGLVNRVVPADRLVAEVDALADRLARVPPDVMAPTKLLLIGRWRRLASSRRSRPASISSR